MRHDESRLQRGCVRWFRAQYPKLSRNLCAIPNGGARDAVTGAILKGEGVVAGVADLILFRPSGQFHALCIEMKTPKGRQSPEQMAWEEAVSEQGYKYIICRSLEDFIAQVSSSLKGDFSI